jgi:hypothetical protein
MDGPGTRRTPAARLAVQAYGRPDPGFAGWRLAADLRDRRIARITDQQVAHPAYLPDRRAYPGQSTGHQPVIVRRGGVVLRVVPHMCRAAARRLVGFGQLGIRPGGYGVG